MTADPFGFDLEEELPRRDRWSRPLLIPNGKTEREAYTRASSLSNMVTDSSALHTWEKRNLVMGLSRRTDLYHLAATLPPLHDAISHKSLLTKEQRKADADTKKQIDEIIEAAREQAFGSYKARLGTSRHNACEPGADHDGLPAEIVADAEAFKAELSRRGIEIACHELFVASDDLMVAGSFDYLVWVPELGWVILDIKTGSVDPGSDGLKHAIQLAVYANSEVYDLHTDTRSPLESLTAGEEINRKVGIVAHLPVDQAKCYLYTVDLEVGLRGAKLATMVRSARQVKNVMAMLPSMPAVAAS